VRRDDKEEEEPSRGGENWRRNSLTKKRQGETLLLVGKPSFNGSGPVRLRAHDNRKKAKKKQRKDREFSGKKGWEKT